MEQLYFGPLEEKREIGVCRIRKSYLYTIALNECLHNHPVNSFPDILGQCGITLSFSLDRYWFCLTGLRKEVYWQVYGWSAEDYLALYGQIRQRMVELVAGCGWQADIFMVMMDDEKQIAILMSPENNAAVSPEILAQKLGNVAQEMYERYIFKNDNRYCNITALSGPLSGFADMRKGYLQTHELYDLSFFHMAPEVFTTARANDLHSGTDYLAIIEECTRLTAALDRGSHNDSRCELEQLFLDLLRGTGSRELLQDALSYCRHAIQVRCTVRELSPLPDFNALFSIRACLRIEEWVDRLWPVLDVLCTAVKA